MRVLILEDEIPAQMQMKRLLSSHYPYAEITAVIDSVDQAALWLSKDTPDLIFMDVELSDGICFELFNRIEHMPPVIIVTAYEHYALAALKECGRLPAQTGGDAEFVAAVEKCRKMPSLQKELRSLGKTLAAQSTFKQRFVVKVGDRIIVVPHGRYCLFLLGRQKYVYHDQEGHFVRIRLQSDALESQLNPAEFLNFPETVWPISTPLSLFLNILTAA